ncbi:MAG: MFS transporter [Dehalococcoidia bacterium]
MYPRPFYVLYVSVFVATLGISMVSPLLPVYAKDLGATGIWIGLTFSIFAVTQTIFGPFAGRISDRYGRKPFIVGGLLFYFVAALGYLTAQSFYQVMAFRALSGVGTSLIFSVSRAYIGEMVPSGHEGRWFGVFATADIIGFGTGPILAGVIRQVFSFDSVFVAMAALLFASAGIVQVLLPKEPDSSLRGQGAAADATPDVGLVAALKDRLALAVTLMMGFTSLSFGATFSFLAVRLENDLGVIPALVGVAFAVENIASGIAQPFMGRVADRLDRRLVVSVGFAITATMLFLLGLANSLVMVIVLLALMGVGQAVSWVTSSALQVVAGRRVGMGTVLGLGSGSGGIGILIGSVVGGLIVDISDIRAAFFFGGIVMALGLPLFLALTHGVPTRDEEEPVAEAAAAGGA